MLDDVVDEAQLGDHLREHVRQERLRPVRESPLRVRVDFDEDAVGADRDPSARE